jgi:photosystem II stability/assembly factor-like uncharacterized protein
LVQVLATDPDSSSIVYAGTNGGGFYKSADGGATWTAGGRLPLARKTDYSAVVQILRGPAGSSTLYANTLKQRFRSTDGGLTWQEIDFRLVADYAQLAVDPANRAVIYAATAEKHGLLRSDDAGLTWRVVSDEIRPLVIGVDPSDTSVLYGFARIGSNRFTMFKSADRGATWMQLCDPPASPPEVRQIIVDPRDSSVVYALGDFLYKSTDGGQRWATLPLPTYYPPALVFDPSTPTTLYAVGWGVFRSTDAGAMWQPAGSK